jgi:hypothetical protein
MRARITVLVLSAFIILGFNTSSARAGGSVTYLGKTTWTFTITDSTKQSDIGMTATITGGISKIGDEFYLFQGYVISPDDGPFVVSGSGFLMKGTTGNTLEFTLSESQHHTDSTWRDGGVMHISIDETTLNGTFYDIGHDFKTDSTDRQFDERFSAGTLTLNGSTITF